MSVDGSADFTEPSDFPELSGFNDLSGFDDFSGSSGSLDSGSPAGGFGVSTGLMQSAMSDLCTMADGSVGAVGRFQGLTLDAATFGGIGSAVGTAHDALSSHLGSALSSVNQGFSGLNTSLDSVLSGYLSVDGRISDSYSSLLLADNGTPAGSTATDAGPSADPGPAAGAGPSTGAAPAPDAAPATDAAAATGASPLPALTTLGTHHYGDSGPDVRTLQQQLTDLGYPVGTVDGQWGVRTSAALAQYAHDQGVTLPAAPGQVDPAVVQSIMNSESSTGAVHYQGGVPEIYGFRQSSHNGYDAILAARQQFGQGSAGEQAAVTQAITNEARQVGATQFTDPGIQAALISSAHMRGPGGTMAMLNSMASGQPSNYADTRLNPGTLTTLQQLTPDQFQQQFHDARENYDLDHYIDGGRIDHGAHGTIDGATNWGGLQGRYDREQQQFEQMSPRN